MRVDENQLSVKTTSSEKVNQITTFVYEIVGCSNLYMNNIKEKIEKDYRCNKISWKIKNIIRSSAMN